MYAQKNEHTQLSIKHIYVLWASLEKKDNRQ